MNGLYEPTDEECEWESETEEDGDKKEGAVDEVNVLAVRIYMIPLL